MKKNKLSQSATSKIKVAKDDKRSVKVQEVAQNISDDLSMNDSCTLGATRTVDGVLQVCIKDAFGDNVWSVEETFSSALNKQS